MKTRKPSNRMPRLWLALLLVAAQGVLFAHGIDELTNPSQAVCDLCVTGHSAGASVVPAQQHYISQPQHGLCSTVIATPVVVSSAYTPCQRAPPSTR